MGENRGKKGKEMELGEADKGEKSLYLRKKSLYFGKKSLFLQKKNHFFGPKNILFLQAGEERGALSGSRREFRDFGEFRGVLENSGILGPWEGILGAIAAPEGRERERSGLKILGSKAEILGFPGEISPLEF